MMTKCFILISALVAVCSAGVVPAAVPAALTVGTYASSYNAHSVNHAYAAPYVAAPAVAAPALAYSALPAAYSALPAAYSSLPAAYSALPAAYSAYHYPGAYAAAPLIAARR